MGCLKDPTFDPANLAVWAVWPFPNACHGDDRACNFTAHKSAILLNSYRCSVQLKISAESNSGQWCRNNTCCYGDDDETDQNPHDCEHPSCITTWGTVTISGKHAQILMRLEVFVRSPYYFCWIQLPWCLAGVMFIMPLRVRKACWWLKLVYVIRGTSHYDQLKTNSLTQLSSWLQKPTRSLQGHQYGMDEEIRLGCTMYPVMVKICYFSCLLKVAPYSLRLFS